MIPPTQYDTRGSNSSGRNRGKHAFRPVGRSINAGSAMTRATTEEKLTFGEDFVLEHSAPRLPIALVKRSGDAGSGRKDMQHSPQAYGFPC